MSEEKKPDELFTWEATPEMAPIRVKAKKWKQASWEVYSAPCPQCHPGLTLDAPVQQMVNVNQPGRIICRCGAYLELYHEASEEVTPQ